MESKPKTKISRKAERDVVVIDGVRTPFIKSGTTFRDLPAHELGKIALSEILHRADLDPGTIDEVIIGNVATPIEATNIARVIALRSGIPEEIPSYTVNRNCASGFQAITEACYRIAAGTHDVIVVGGAESMSGIPLYLPPEFGAFTADLKRSKKWTGKLRVVGKFRPDYVKPIDGLSRSLTDYHSGLTMGQTAEILAREFGIGRVEQDEFALASHKKTARAVRKGVFGVETVPVYAPPGYDPVEADNGPREDQTMKSLSGLEPVIDGRHGTITAGNSCPVTDGAAAILITSRKRARELGYEPLGKIRSFGYAGLEPRRMGLGPSFATPFALKKARIQLKEIELIELNEAFAAQVIANERCFASGEFATEQLGQSKAIGEIDRSILNVNGGAIAIGHPVSATGLRMVTTLLREMERRDLELGLATMCVGGGQGGAMVLERN